MILREANRFCIRLWKDEGGVVLALTVIVFLSLFVMACSVYAIGENIRQRIEIQHAADSTAYAAAVVQADGVSRMAAINRAMAWTYAQLVKMQMDYIAHKWLDEVIEQYKEDRDDSEDFNESSIDGCDACTSKCPIGFDTLGIPELVFGKWFIGDPLTFIPPALDPPLSNLDVNGDGDWFTNVEIMNTLERVRLLLPLPVELRIELSKLNIEFMNLAQDALELALPFQISQAVDEAIRINMQNAETPADVLAGGADIRYALMLNQIHAAVANPLVVDYFDENIDEEDFFLRFGIENLAEDEFQSGWDTWFPLTSESGGEDGFQRKYDTAFDLTASWRYRGTRWLCIPIPNPFDPPCSCLKIPIGFHGTLIIGSLREVKASDDDVGLDDDDYETAIAHPRRLIPGFFAEEGAIVVGVARKVNNPLQALVGAAGNPAGLFNAFAVHAEPRYMWSAAASRAGYRDVRPSLSTSEAHYNSTIDSHIITDRSPQGISVSENKSRWMQDGWAKGEPDYSNLRQSDWDATLIPLRRAWSERRAAWEDRPRIAGIGGGYEAGYWEDDAANLVLSALWNIAPWSALGGGGGTRLSSLSGGQALGPPAMSGEGNNINYFLFDQPMFH